MKELKRIGGILKNYVLECILAPVFKLLEAAFELIVPLVMAQIIDVGIPTANRGFVLQQGMILVLLAVIGLISAITAQYFSAKLAAGFGTSLRNDLFEKILSLPHSQLDIHGRNTLLTRILSDTAQLQTGVNMFFRLVLRSPFIVIGAMLMAFRIDKIQGILFLIVILCLAITVVFLSGRTVILYKAVQKTLDTIMGRTLENLTGVRVIRAFSAEKHEMSHFQAAADELYDAQVRAGNISILISPLTYVMINLGVAAILYTGSIDVSVGRLSGGQVVALVNYMLQILAELVKTANLVTLLSKSFTCAKRIEEIFLIPVSVEEGNLDAFFVEKEWKDNQKDAFLAFSHVDFQYPLAADLALRDIDFCVKKGQTVGIIGGTGSGKTTLINLLPRFYDVCSGEIQLMGHPIADYSLKSLRDFIGLAEQKSRLFMGDIRSNLEWGKNNPSEDELNRAVSLAQASDILEKKEVEGGFFAAVGQSGTNFSGGQRQRLSLSRTLIKDAPILILDDVSSALDYLTDASLRKAIREQLKKTTVFLLAQRVSSIRHADFILVMDGGRIVGKGKHEELLQSCTIYQEICASQLEGGKENEAK